VNRKDSIYPTQSKTETPVKNSNNHFALCHIQVNLSSNASSARGRQFNLEKFVTTLAKAWEKQSSNDTIDSKRKVISEAS